MLFHFHSQSIKLNRNDVEKKKRFDFIINCNRLQCNGILCIINGQYCSVSGFIFTTEILSNFINIILLCYLTIVCFQNKQLSYLIKTRKDGIHGLNHYYDTSTIL